MALPLARMELKVNVDGYVRVVCGVTEETTCQDVVIALAHAMGRTGRFSLLEKWRIQERSLPPWERPLKVLQKWGEYAAEVQFTLQQTDREDVRKATDAINKVGITGPERCTQNFSPPPPVESNVKRSLTFSGAHCYSQSQKMGGTSTFVRHSIPHSTPEQSTPSYHTTKHSQNHCSKPDYHQYNQQQTTSSQPHKNFRQKPHPQHYPQHKPLGTQPNWPQNFSTFSNPPKPISSIKPQPKPRTLKSVTEKLPSRTVGTVSPIQIQGQSTSVGRATSPHSRFSQGEARASLDQVSHYASRPETIKINNGNRRNNNNINNNIDDDDDDDLNSNSSNSSELQILDNLNTEEDSIDGVIADPSTHIGNVQKQRTKNCFGKDIMTMRSHNLTQIEEYDLDKNFPLSLRSSPDTDLDENHAECYVMQEENEFEKEPSEDPDSQALLQLINIQHEELELQKGRINDIDLEIISAEKLIETEKQIEELQSLSDDYEEEMVSLEPWPQILDEEQHTEQALYSEMSSYKRKIDECEDRLQKAQSRISELTRELELEVSKIEDEISDIQDKIKNGIMEGDKYQEAINSINKEISELDSELEKKQMEESKISEEVKQLNLKELGQKPILEATKLSETGEVILKLLEKQQQFTRQGSGSKKAAGSKTENETVTTSLEPKPMTNDGVWV